MTFEPYMKIKRFTGAIMTITEKIDGTNGQVVVSPETSIETIGSRKRPITPDADNFDFAKFVLSHGADFAKALGPGRHYGEWAGPGIQKNPLGLPERLFFLFNTQAWNEDRLAWAQQLVPRLRVVPVLFTGNFDMKEIDNQLELLYTLGSSVPDAAPGNAPEGIIISAFGTKFKKTRDDRPKGTRA